VTVHRLTPLPVAPARGHLVISESVAERTMELLAVELGRAVPHEALVWWLGRQVGDDTYVMACISPTVDSGRQHVLADADAVGDAAAAARRSRLGIVAQVHSHPGNDTRHSDGDDELVLMPFEGMFSVVVARYGAGGLRPASGAGIHQYQNGIWTWVSNADEAFVVVSTELRP